MLKLPGTNLLFSSTMFGVAEFTTGGNSPTGPKLGSGRLSNGLIISGIPSSDKGT